MSALPPTDVRNTVVLVAYLDPLVRGSRVVVIGDSESGAAELFLELGARAVHVFDVDAARAKRATPHRGVTVAPLPPHDFDVRDGAFDLALVPDLSVLADPPASLARLRRVLGAEGTLLVAAPNPESVGRGIGYYELYDLVALQFASVKMVAAIPFAGATLAALGEGEPPDVSVDTQLAGAPPTPTLFCAVASQRDVVEISPYAIIQLPPGPQGEAAPALEKEEKTDPGVLVALESALAEARLRIEALEGKLKEQASEHKRRMRDVEGTLAEAQIRADQLEAELAEANRLNRTQELETELDALRAAAEERVEKAESETGAPDEVTQLEERLRELAATLAEAQKEVQRREAIVKELLMTVEQLSQNGDEGLREKLDMLALELARRHSELEAARWRIAELEQKMARPAGGTPRPPEAEIDMLRQALVKEHEARTIAESGEALEQARGELQRQAVLIDQLSRDPSR